MAALSIAMHVLVFLFFLGMAGSSIVILISFVEDIKHLFSKE